MKFFSQMALILCSLWLLGIMSAKATVPGPQGISFHVMRVIYPANEQKGVTLTAYNHSDSPYLMQSWIRPVDAKTGDVDLDYNGLPKMPFIVTPPLARLEAKGELTLRIRRNGEPLPTDRESVFYLSMKAIPAKGQVDKASSSGQVAMTVVSSMKVFYRPEGLAQRAVVDVASQLRFRRDGNTLIAQNPTPYWLTFSQLKMGDVELDNTALRLMVPPKGQQRYILPAEAGNQVSWKLIDEDGWDTALQQQTL